MENFGIDIGDHKTVIAGSSRNGRIIPDDLQKRTIPTLLQLSTPNRKFGNHVAGMKRQDMLARHRHFLADQAVLTMYFCYLHRLIRQNVHGEGAPMVTISTRHAGLADIEQMLMCARAAGLDVVGVYDELTCAAACLALKVKAHRMFVMADFGHSHTSIGLFTFRNNVLSAVDIERIDVGGGHFDERLFHHIMAQCDVETDDGQHADEAVRSDGQHVGKAVRSDGEHVDSQARDSKGMADKQHMDKAVRKETGSVQTGHADSQARDGKGIAVDRTVRGGVRYKETYRYLSLRETVIPQLKKYKMILSNMPVVEDTLWIGDDCVTIRITQDDLRRIIADEMHTLEHFISRKMAEYPKDVVVEVVGGNSNSMFVKEMLERLGVHAGRSCDSHESVAVGAAVAGALQFYMTGVRVHDYLHADVLVNKEVLYRRGAIVEREVVVDRKEDRLCWTVGGHCSTGEQTSDEQTDGKASTDQCKCDGPTDQSNQANQSSRTSKTGDEQSSQSNKTDSDQSSQSSQSGKTSGQSNQSNKTTTDQPDKDVVCMPYTDTFTFTCSDAVLLQARLSVPFTATLTRSKQLRISTYEHTEDVSHLRRAEDEYRQRELEIEQIGHSANEYQLFLERLQAVMNKPIFYALFTETETETVHTITSEFVYTPVADTLHEQQTIISTFDRRVQPYVQRMKELVECKRKAVLERIGKSEQGLKDVRVYTPGVYRLQARLNGLRSVVDACTYDGDVDVLNLDALDEEIVRMELSIEKERKEKEEKERKEKEERERREKEERERREKEEKEGKDEDKDDKDKGKDKESDKDGK